MTSPSDERGATIKQQIAAVDTAANQAEAGARDVGMSTGGFAAYLRAAAATLRKVQARECVLVRKGEQRMTNPPSGAALTQETWGAYKSPDESSHWVVYSFVEGIAQEIICTCWRGERDAIAIAAQSRRIAELEAERDNFHMDYRMKCDEQAKALSMRAEAAERALKQILDSAETAPRGNLKIIASAALAQSSPESR